MYRGNSQEWIISHEELWRIGNEGLCALRNTVTVRRRLKEPRLSDWNGQLRLDTSVVTSCGDDR